MTEEQMTVLALIFVAILGGAVLLMFWFTISTAAALNSGLTLAYFVVGGSFTLLALALLIWGAWPLVKYLRGS